jgi:tRNA(fMet)-specific endonuclease VapC
VILLDTDHISLLQWAGPEAGAIRRRLGALAEGGLTTSIVTYEEQTRGWMSELAKAATMRDQIQIYSRMHATLDFFATLKILDFTEKAATEFQRLKKARVRIGTMDLKIAAIALAFDATLWTRNTRDFSQVAGLRFEDVTR